MCERRLIKRRWHNVTAAVILASAVLISGCSGLSGLGGFGEDDADYGSSSDPSSSLTTEQQPSGIDGKIPASLYFADTDNNRICCEIRYINSENATKSVNSLCEALINELLLGPDSALGVSGSYFGSVVLNGETEVDASKGMVTIDLSEDFLSCGNGKESNEKLIIYSIVDTLTEIKDIQRVKINIDGQQQKNMKSGLSLSEPFERDESYLNGDTSPDPSTTAAGSETDTTPDTTTGTKNNKKKNRQKALESAILNGSATDKQVADVGNTITEGLYDNE